MQDYLSVGRMINIHGVKGEIKVFPSTSDVSRFDYLIRIFVDVSPSGAKSGDLSSPDKDTPLKEFFVESVRYHKTNVLLKLRGITDADAAEFFKGREIWIPREDARELDEDEWFICDLIGLKVFEAGQLLGTLIDVIQTGSNDVYVVKGEDKKEILIPAITNVLLDVNLESGRIEVKLPEGLLDGF